MTVERNIAEMIRRKMAANPGLAARIEEESFLCSVGCSIHEAREAVGMTQAELGSLVCLAPEAIDAIENADYGDLPLWYLHRIARAFGMSARIELIKPPANDGEWTGAKADRRGDLVDMAQVIGLTSAEESELASLQEAFARHQDHISQSPKD